MRLPVATVGLLVALTGLCVPGDASRVAFLSGVHGGGSGSLSGARPSHLIRHPSRRLLQVTAVAPATVTAAPSPDAVVVNATGTAAAPGPAADEPPVDNRGNFAGAQFGFQFNNNVAFIGVAIILGLAVSCFWGVCGVYRRRRLAAHRFSGPPGASGNVPEVQLAPQDVKMTVQPIVVIQPDNESIAYTFRELQPDGGKGGAKGDKHGDAAGCCADTSTENSEQQGEAAHSAGQSSSSRDAGGGSGGISDDAAGAAAPTAAEGAADGTAGGRPAAAADEAAQAVAAQPAGSSQPGQPAEAVAALQEAGLLQRHSSRRRRPLGIPQLLEWDLGAALAALDAERAATDQPSLSRGVAAAAAAALTRSASGSLAPGSRAGSFVALSRSPSGVLGAGSRTPSAAALHRSPSGGLAAGGQQ